MAETDTVDLEWVETIRGKYAQEVNLALLIELVGQQVKLTRPSAVDEDAEDDLPQQPPASITFKMQGFSQDTIRRPDGTPSEWVFSFRLISDEGKSFPVEQGCEIELVQDRTPAEWAERKDYVIVHADGWSSKFTIRGQVYEARPYDDPISESEFEARCLMSTTKMP